MSNYFVDLCGISIRTVNHSPSALIKSTAPPASRTILSTIERPIPRPRSRTSPDFDLSA